VFDAADTPQVTTALRPPEAVQQSQQSQQSPHSQQHSPHSQHSQHSPQSQQRLKQPRPTTGEDSPL